MRARSRRSRRTAATSASPRRVAGTPRGVARAAGATALTAAVGAWAATAPRPPRCRLPARRDRRPRSRSGAADCRAASGGVSLAHGRQRHQEQRPEAASPPAGLAPGRHQAGWLNPTPVGSATRRCEYPHQHHAHGLGHHRPEQPRHTLPASCDDLLIRAHARYQRLLQRHVLQAALSHIAAGRPSREVFDRGLYTVVPIAPIRRWAGPSAARCAEASGCGALPAQAPPA